MSEAPIYTHTLQYRYNKTPFDRLVGLSSGSTQSEVRACVRSFLSFLLSCSNPQLNLLGPKRVSQNIAHLLMAVDGRKKGKKENWREHTSAADCGWAHSGVSPPCPYTQQAPPCPLQGTWEVTVLSFSFKFFLWFCRLSEVSSSFFLCFFGSETPTFSMTQDPITQEPHSTAEPWPETNNSKIPGWFLVQI